VAALLAHYSRRFLYLKILRCTLVAGALYDLAFAALLLWVPGVPASVLDLPLPGEPFYLWVMAVLLGMVAACYAMAAHDVRRYGGIIAVAIAGRLAGALVMAVAAAGRADLGGLYWLAGVDALFGLSHAACWWPVRS
jgi:hypothetical protein